MAEVTMPRLSDTMSEGTVGRWLKQLGEPVAVGEIIAEIETDKATMELESFDAGKLQQIVVPAGQTVPIGTVIAYIGEGEVVATPPPAPTAPTVATATPRIAPSTASHNGVSHERVKASPLARQIAKQKGIDLHTISGSGPGGRVVKQDVEQYVAPAEQQVPSSGAPMSRMRQAIARTMSASKPGIPHMYLTMEIAMDAAVALREQIRTTGVKVSLNDMVVKAAALALRTVPALNASYQNDANGQPAILSHTAINIGVAVALTDGLVAPVVRDADSKPLSVVSSEIHTMAHRAREGKIKQHELEGATFQVTSLGMYGISEFGSIITPPQAASLAVAAVRKVPVVRHDQIVIGQVMNVTLSADHRVVDGAIGAAYLKELKRLLEAPLSIIV
ncbi:Dihydrolipoyllysine-residue succinyltransferase [Oscillochloris trichoides DG-6]|uniref:Dihydrolipoamide acetyltransferase component of pyruvate dehydrogenase complex n=1 Tax=Oscillochloris trichoides DG-6 TaxID=765420 RepID=E1IEZ5_9CHLR|nr:dihydrolipoamide acetyltransferase family protein [Oscillochloris trichoides]EFO80240.1 Dihydrolipoyllysine-residue succinyltransferase [Oscillochloris trichoides DG-6]